MVRAVSLRTLRVAFAGISCNPTRTRLIGQSSNQAASICACPHAASQQFVVADTIRGHRRTQIFSRAATGFPATAPAVMKFDKVPEKLPDWWDEEEEDEEDKGDGGNKGGGRGRWGKGGGGGGGGAGGPGKGFFASLLAMYVNGIKTAPIRTKAVSTSVLALVGDCVAQRIAQAGDEKFTFDLRRSASIGLWGLCFMGPALHYWYGFLDRRFFGKFAVISKLVSDQLAFAPFFNGAFIAGVGSLEGHPLTDVTETLRTKFWPSMKANWILWPAAQLINFTIVPQTFRIVYVNCVALLWNVILTSISHNNDK